MRGSWLGLLIPLAAGCGGNEVCRHLAESRRIDCPEVEAARARAAEINETRPDALLDSEGCTGTLGTFHDGHVVEERTYCSDVCPPHTRLMVLYRGIDTREACDEVGGRVVRDVAWGGIVGCTPSCPDLDELPDGDLRW